MTLFKRCSETAEPTSADRNFEHCEKEFALCYRLVYRMNLVEGLRLKLLHTISSLSYSRSETHVGRNTSMPMKRSNKSSARKINVILKTIMWVSAEKKKIFNGYQVMTTFVLFEIQLAIKERDTRLSDFNFCVKCCFSVVSDMQREIFQKR